MGTLGTPLTSLNPFLQKYFRPSPRRKEVVRFCTKSSYTALPLARRRIAGHECPKRLSACQVSVCVDFERIHPFLNANDGRAVVDVLIQSFYHREAH